MNRHNLTVIEGFGRRTIGVCLPFDRRTAVLGFCPKIVGGQEVVTNRVAQCGCGALQAEVVGDPTGVVACHCVDCQRRSGTPFGVGAYFPTAQVRITGASQLYMRDTARGGKFHQHFCPTCGTTLYWFADSQPDSIGIAVGAFADPQFPSPVRSVWEQSRHSWVKLPDGLLHFPKGRSG